MSTEKLPKIAVLEEAKVFMILITSRLKDAEVSKFKFSDDFMAKIEADETFLHNFDGIITDNHFGEDKLWGIEMAYNLRKRFNYKKPIVMMTVGDLSPEDSEGNIDLLMGKSALRWEDLMKMLSERSKVENPLEKIEMSFDPSRKEIFEATRRRN